MSTTCSAVNGNSKRSICGRKATRRAKSRRRQRRTSVSAIQAGAEIGMAQAGHDAEQGRFSGAVRAGDRHQAGVREFESGFMQAVGESERASTR